eukprot:scaffold3504_cov240-Pinguiococcus_pyrenoidosus.AAC.33
MAFASRLPGFEGLTIERLEPRSGNASSTLARTRTSNGGLAVDQPTPFMALTRYCSTIGNVRGSLNGCSRLASCLALSYAECAKQWTSFFTVASSRQFFGQGIDAPFATSVASILCRREFDGVAARMGRRPRQLHDWLAEGDVDISLVL